MSDDIPVDYVIFKLNEIFNVKSISNALETAKDIKEAKAVHSIRDFDRIPIKVNGVIGSFYDSDSNSEIQIKPELTISESTGIFQTFSCLSRKEFYFVLTGNEITHMVHYSDLNSPLVSIGIYTQIAYCEMAIRDFARLKNPNKLDYGEKFINGINNASGGVMDIARAIRQFKRKKALQTETDLFDELYFDDELVLFREIITPNLDASKKAEFKKFIDLGESRIKTLKDLRNEVMHSKPEIIKKPQDIAVWLNFLQDCQKIISVVDGKTVFNQ